MSDTTNALLHNPKVWTAVFVLVQAILFWAVPTFPKEIWTAIDGLFAVVLTVLTVQETRANNAAIKKANAYPPVPKP